MIVHVSGDPVESVAERMLQVIKTCERPTIAVSGGSTPRALFDRIASDYVDAYDWSQLRLFQVDERCVPPEHADSNWAMIDTHLLQRIPGISAFRMEAERDGADSDYESILDSELGGAPIDIMLLGMGGDGHTASLFPGTAALDESARRVVFNEVPQLNTRRMTMTYPIINEARHKWFLAKGADKAEAFSHVQRGELPAAGVTDAEWYIDEGMAR